MDLEGIHETLRVGQVVVEAAPQGVSVTSRNPDILEVFRDEHPEGGMPILVFRALKPGKARLTILAEVEVLKEEGDAGPEE